MSPRRVQADVRFEVHKIIRHGKGCHFNLCEPDMPGLAKITLEGASGCYGITLRWKNLEKSLPFNGGMLKLYTEGSDTEIATLRLARGEFPPAKSGSFDFEGLHMISTYTKYVLELVEFPEGPVCPRAQSFFESMRCQDSNNVLISFPRTGHSLWSNESILSDASPYLSALLKSGFSESTALDDECPTPDTSNRFEPYEYDDSDEERDELDKATEKGREAERAGFKRITVVQSTYTTYSNVICWIGSGYIRFAPLKSVGRFSPSSSDSEQSEENSQTTVKRTRVPRPASPKSVYRLAHLLELPELSALALDNFKLQLTPANVAHELYTDVASTHAELRDVALDYVAEHWKEVIESKAWTDMLNDTSAGGPDGHTGMLLSQKLMEKWGTSNKDADGA